MINLDKFGDKDAGFLKVSAPTLKSASDVTEIREASIAKALEKVVKK